MTEPVNECEYSKPAYPNAQHLRTCTSDYATHPYHCTRSGWQEHYKECPWRTKLKDAGIPEPAPEEKVPEPIKWNAIFRKPEEPKSK